MTVGSGIGDRGSGRWLPVALLVVAVLPYFLYLGASSIWDANEAFYVETPREMIEAGDYVNPSFNYEPRFNKPVLTYWVVAALYRTFGVSVGVQRAAIAVAALLMIGAAFLMARAASAHPLAPWLAAIGLAAGPRFFMFSRRILVDMAMTAMMTLTLLFFVLAEQYPARRRLFLALMYASVGLGVLTKGPVAAVIPALVFVAYLAVHRELGRVRAMMIPTGIVLALAIAMPWYVLLYAQHGWTYITAFFIGENVGRFTSTIGVQARGPFFYLPVLLSDSLPWSLCLPAVVAAWTRDRRAARGVLLASPESCPTAPETLRRDPDEARRAESGRSRDDAAADAAASGGVPVSATVAESQRRVRTLLLLWIAVIVAFFSLSQTKQDLYIFPVVAAVAVLGGAWVAGALDGPARERGWLTLVLLLLAGLLVALGAFVLYVFDAGQTVYRVDGARLSGLLALVGGFVVAALAVLGNRRVRNVPRRGPGGPEQHRTDAGPALRNLSIPDPRSPIPAVFAVLAVFVSFNWMLVLRALPSFEQYKPVVPLSELIAREAAPGDIVVHYDVALPSMVFYLRRHIDILIDREAFLRQMSSGRTVFAVLPADRYEELKPLFGVRTCELGRRATSDIRLRSVLRLEPPPQVVLVTTRCAAS